MQASLEIPSKGSNQAAGANNTADTGFFESSNKTFGSNVIPLLANPAASPRDIKMAEAAPVPTPQAPDTTRTVPVVPQDTLKTAPADTVKVETPAPAPQQVEEKPKGGSAGFSDDALRRKGSAGSMN